MSGGRPRACPDEVLHQVVALRRSGVPYRKIAELLNARSIPTATGRPRWYASYVVRLLQTRDGDRLLHQQPPGPWATGGRQDLWR
jgi:hypothetical protein